jgi:hypothetical protein
VRDCFQIVLQERNLEVNFHQRRESRQLSLCKQHFIIMGKLTLDEYLDRIVFYEERYFTRDTFRTFMEVTDANRHDWIGAHGR